MLRFAAWCWVFFLPLLLLGACYFRPVRRRPLRLLCVLLLGLALVDPQLRRLAKGLDLLVVVDQSASAAESLRPRLAEIEGLLERSKSAEDRLRYLDYAELVQLREEADPIPVSGQQQTRTALALQFALSQLAGDRTGRLLLLTDGQSTEPLTGLVERLRRQNVALDYRLATVPLGQDFRVERLDLPLRAQVGEPFLVEVTVVGQPDGSVPLQLLRDGQPYGSSEVQVVNGLGRLRFTERETRAGAHRYQARTIAPEDVRRGNDAAEKWIEIAGGPRVVLVTEYEGDPLAAVLQAQGFAVETATPGSISPGALTGAKAVILNNVPAYRLKRDFLDAIDFYVRGQGGGLLMAGGPQSFAAGGYYGTAVGDLLPVSMELRQEHRKLAVAMAVVLDRSGSMSASVAGGQVKMDLADEGAARTIELLGPADAVAVYAVDTEPHEVVPLTGLGSNREALLKAARSIQSAGGGICVPTGLKAARAALQKATLGQRHVVLFADANDATQEPPDPEAIRQMVAEGITISVIGLGSETGSGGAYLKEVAEQGKGRIFFNANPAELPALFAQETVAVARAAFIKDPVPLVSSGGWLEIAAAPLSWPGQVDGYNLSYLRPGAASTARSGDGYESPLVAWWPRGAGRTAAVSFPLGGDFSQTVRGWPQYGDFVQTLARWLAGEQVPAGLGLQTRLEGTRLQLDLYHDETWRERFAANAPRALLAEGARDGGRELTWEKVEPGHYSASAQLQPELWVRGAIQVGTASMPFGPVVAGTNVEWLTEAARVQELQTVARESGGQERFDLATIWQAPRHEEFRSLRPYVLILLLLAFLADTLLARLGRGPEWGRKRTRA